MKCNVQTILDFIHQAWGSGYSFLSGGRSLSEEDEALRETSPLNYLLPRTV